MGGGGGGGGASASICVSACACMRIEGTEKDIGRSNYVTRELDILVEANTPRDLILTTIRTVQRCL